jgi:hypothetical protein
LSCPSSQASPRPSPSVSVWSALETEGQLSDASGTPPLSPSRCVEEPWSPTRSASIRSLPARFPPRTPIVCVPSGTSTSHVLFWYDVDPWAMRLAPCRTPSTNTLIVTAPVEVVAVLLLTTTWSTGPLSSTVRVAVPALSHLKAEASSASASCTWAAKEPLDMLSASNPESSAASAGGPTEVSAKASNKASLSRLLPPLRALVFRGWSINAFLLPVDRPRERQSCTNPPFLLRERVVRLRRLD